ncbi:YqjD family protein [Lacisediminimonas sp.]|uniref:DUF883 family protein n=1 Tax=Lacisediminimonas sp. TaxID=3060582 RepID=UPI0027237EB2|nr:DUF883 domain-containing protein [Lacisediminimonas sp.]MDO8300725.1 DUF883 domain-containing protein [Lacisediminimonas sp.]MDO9218506.1 DUF883 domain-containing protein [Lacisediminimonas sp.]
METNYPSSGSKGSMPASAGSAGTGNYDDIGGLGAGGQAGAQSGAWSADTGYQRSAVPSGSLRDELSNLKRDLDDLVSRAAVLSDRELGEARDKMMVKFSSMRSAARGVAEQARTQLNQGMDVTSDYVRDKPLQSVAIAAGFGLLVGALIRGGRH